MPIFERFVGGVIHAREHRGYIIIVVVFGTGGGGQELLEFYPAPLPTASAYPAPLPTASALFGTDALPCRQPRTLLNTRAGSAPGSRELLSERRPAGTT